jgi:hypothetical protein
MRWIGFLFLIACIGCADKQRTPVLGMWTGGFYTDKAEVLRGYLQLYKTGDKFKMRLATREQEMNFAGTWAIAKGRVELHISDVQFENPTDEERKARGIRVFDSEKVREAIAKPIALDLIDDGKTFRGLTMTLDQVQGRLGFTKGAVTKETQEALDKMRTNR